MVKKVKVGPVGEGSRLDVFISPLLEPRSRVLAQQLSKESKVLVNGKIAKASLKLKAGDKVTITQEKIKKPAPLKLDIIYEDDNTVVIDKPAGILTHSKGVFNAESTVASFIAPKLKGMAGERAGIVHRLDRTTSGVIICAKNLKAQRYLQKQFAQRKVEKVYLAIVEGELKPSAALIDMPIERHPKNPKTFRVGSAGRPAQTKYKVISTFNKFGTTYSYLELQPLTGRTHQLRVHLSKIGHPIIGDTLYVGPGSTRVMLHAYKLKIRLPDGQTQSFSAKIPEEFTQFKEANDA